MIIVDVETEVLAVVMMAIIIVIVAVLRNFKSGFFLRNQTWIIQHQVARNKFIKNLSADRHNKLNWRNNNK